MGNGEGSHSGGTNWPVRIVGAVGAGVGLALAMWLGPQIGVRGVWGIITVMAGTAIGVVVGNLVGLLIFGRPPASGPPA